MQPEEPSGDLEEGSEGAASACHQLTEAPVDLGIPKTLAGIRSGMKPFFGWCRVVCKWWLDPVGSGGDLPLGASRWPRVRGAEGRIRHIPMELWLQSCFQLPTGPAVLWDIHRAQSSPGKGLRVCSPLPSSPA